MESLRMVKPYHHDQRIFRMSQIGFNLERPRTARDAYSLYVTPT